MKNLTVKIGREDKPPPMTEVSECRTAS